MLTPSCYQLLEALDEDGGFTTGDVTKRSQLSFGCNAHQRSGAARSFLMLMMRDGYVRQMDDLKPVCWVRTPKGTAALKART